MQHIGKNIKKIREEKGLTQQAIADLIAMHRSNYSRVETDDRDLSIEAVGKIARFFNMTIDDLVNFEGEIPNEVTFDDKNTIEQMQLIQQLDEEDKTTVFKIVETMLTKKKFKDFFNKNVAAL
ncbi:helix-turn-helix domain-containing protein [Chryseobacterium turcicum]|uniref:Helix-turn-helix domain-containing protein n=1 Tax=Chryseobacterium turcicum TaxID=2898076 RepID=A0A9Q3YZ12_9FLAO|nr:helix-turn-helix transcriptional regulator [Chryseobacterium turcicum]MCD1117450.1 helix-turn-helix domain-containing protein [Chryseobacterium turcicum]